MRIHFVPDLSGAPWTGPRPQASYGEIWVGPRGFVERLETALGLGGPYRPEPVRAYSLVAAITATHGFWSDSAEADPLAVARTLLSWRDELMLHGWRGQPLTHRLGQLAEVAEAVEPGLPDRLLSIRDTLQRRAAAVDEVHLVEPDGRLPRLWQEVLERLAARGTRIVIAPPTPVSATGDLRAARERRFVPTGDHSLQLVRSAGPLEAADELAGWLAVQPDLDDTVIIGPDSVLDRALARYGLPTTGAPDPHDNVLLQLLPLVLAMGWSPPDPARALELATVAASPIPRRLAHKLAESLHRWPAVGSDAWLEALSEGLEQLDDDYRAQVTERLDVLLSPCAEGERYPADGARERVTELMSWMVARRDYDEVSDPWDAALAQCDRFLLLLGASGLSQLSRPSLHRLLEEAQRTAPALARHGDQAGLAWVAEPSAVLGPAGRIVWWRFDRRSAPSIAQVPLSPQERHALAKADCALPDPGREAETVATRWRRPLEQALEQLVLVCPEVGDDGDAAYPHPLWDELMARLGEGSGGERVVHPRPRSDVMPFRKPREPFAQPAPRRDWSVTPERLHPLERESPTSLSSLVGCSFKWAVTYMGRIIGGVTTALPHAERLLGSVVHEVLSRVLTTHEPLSPDEAAERAAELFEREGPRLAAAIFWPGAEPLRNTAVRVIREACKDLFRQIQSSGLQVVLVETEVETTALGRRLRGRPDVVLGEPAAVVDLKWGGATFRRDQLREGTAYQLAVYAHLLKDPAVETYPAAAYFILRDQRMLTTAAWAFPKAEHVDGPGTEVTWQALERAQGQGWERLREGRLSAPANPDEQGVVRAPEDGIAGGVLTLAPPCRFCELDALCGLRFGAGE